MKRMIQAELLKMRHSTMGKMTWLVPVAAVVLGYLISQVGLYAQQFTYNIWYGTFYPCLVPLICAMNLSLIHIFLNRVLDNMMYKCYITTRTKEKKIY